VCSKQSSRTTTLSVRYAAHLRRVVAHTHLFSSLTSAVLHLVFFGGGFVLIAGAATETAARARCRRHAWCGRSGCGRRGRCVRLGHCGEPELTAVCKRKGTQPVRQVVSLGSPASRIGFGLFGFPVFCPTLTFELFFFTPCERLQICVR
jgi:hypothetical protein